MCHYVKNYGYYVLFIFEILNTIIINSDYSYFKSRFLLLPILIFLGKHVQNIFRTIGIMFRGVKSTFRTFGFNR